MKKTLVAEASEGAWQALLTIISDGIWDWNANTGHVHRSPGWYTMLGYDIDALANTVFTWESIIHKDDFDRVMTHFDQYTRQMSDHYQIEYRCRMKSGNYLWIEDRAKIIEWNADGSVARMLGAHRNIDAQKQLQLQHQNNQSSLQELLDARSLELMNVNSQLEMKVIEAERLATTDSLTTLANRYHFEQKLKLECARAQRFNEPLSLIAIDIDNFKTINDQNGHATGDLLLVKVAQLILANIRKIDLAARWGGDELMVLLPNTTLPKANNVAEKLRCAISEAKIANHLQVTGSFGVAELRNEEDPVRFTIRADDALYRAKQNGRNQVLTSLTNENR